MNKRLKHPDERWLCSSQVLEALRSSGIPEKLMTEARQSGQLNFKVSQRGTIYNPESVCTIIQNYFQTLRHS